MIVKKLEELHEGAIGERGMFTHYNDNGKKKLHIKDYLLTGKHI